MASECPRSPEQSKINALKHDVFDMRRYVGIPDFNPTHTLHVKFGKPTYDEYNNINEYNNNSPTEDDDDNNEKNEKKDNNENNDMNEQKDNEKNENNKIEDNENSKDDNNGNNKESNNHHNNNNEERREEQEGIECGCGGLLTNEDTINPPINVWWEGPKAESDDDYYTLVELDLDSPTKAKGWMLSPILHYMVVNIDFVPSSDTPWSFVLNRSVVIRNYLKPSPPPGSGPHRYVFVLCKQSKHYDLRDADNLKKLGKIKLNWPQIMQEYKLQPMAVDFFLCQNGGQRCTIS